MREGWAQRVVQAMSAVYGISMEEYTSDGTNTGLWLDPDEDENEKEDEGESRSEADAVNSKTESGNEN